MGPRTRPSEIHASGAPVSRMISGERAPSTRSWASALEDLPQARADGDPDVLEVTSRAGILDPLGAVAPDVRDRPVDGADDVREADLGRSAREPKAPGCAALALHDPRVLEVEEHALEELDRDVLPRGERCPSGAHRDRPPPAQRRPQPRSRSVPRHACRDFVTDRASGARSIGAYPRRVAPDPTPTAAARRPAHRAPVRRAL